MSEEILLIPSSNGLGHAKRLIALYNRLQQIDIRSTLLLNEKQYKLCYDEIFKLRAGEVLLSNSNVGLDGPFTSGASIPLSEVLLNRVSAAQIVISDNVLWPSTYNENVFLHGHFSWVDYWINSTKSAPTNLQIELAADWSRNLRGWFRTEFFGFPETKIQTRQFQMPLIRYLGDEKFCKYERRWEEIWISVGTTEDPDFSKSHHFGLNQDNFVYRHLETFQFHRNRVLPGIVLGRPGLGTLRDCLSSKTLFVPNHEDILDPELLNNWNVLKNKGLTSRLLDLSISDAKSKSDIYGQVWSQISVPIEEYVDRILAITSEVCF